MSEYNGHKSYAHWNVALWLYTFTTVRAAIAGESRKAPK